MQLGFAKAHDKSTRSRKGGRGPGLGELPKIWGFPFSIYTVADASDFKFGTQLGFATAHNKIQQNKPSDTVVNNYIGIFYMTAQYRNEMHHSAPD